MSPLQIEILLHTYSRADGYRGECFGSPAYHDATAQFLVNGLIEPDEKRLTGFSLTDKGQATVDALVAVPMVQP